MDARPDVHKSLTQLKEEWSSCTKCELGQRRLEVQGSFVFGQGTSHGVMLIGEGPGVDEEKFGEPFVGKSGQLLRQILGAIGMTEFYITNLVTCRSCTKQTDGGGQYIFRKNHRTGLPEHVYKDEPPTPPQYLACIPRLYEEIYIVDPTIIVGLGGKACEALLGKPITITRDRGDTSQISIPGASFTPDLTEKRQEWMRRRDGTITTPVDQNMVRYLFLPTLHPAYVLRKKDDKGPDSPLRQLISDLRKALKTHEMYQETVFGTVFTSPPEENDDLLHQQLQEEDDSE